MLIVKSYWGEQSNDFTDVDVRRMDSYLHIASENLQRAIAKMQDLKSDRHISSHDARLHLRSELTAVVEYVRPFIG